MNGILGRAGQLQLFLLVSFQRFSACLQMKGVQNKHESNDTHEEVAMGNLKRWYVCISTLVPVSAHDAFMGRAVSCSSPQCFCPSVLLGSYSF